MSALKIPAEEFQRRVIIDLLAEDHAADPAEALNVWILSAALADFGQDVTADQVDNQVDWLAGEGLVEIACELAPRTVRVTGKGTSVAAGKLAVEGVAPRPD